MSFVYHPRRGANGGVAYASETIDVQELGKAEPATFIEARNATAVDIARITGVPASLIDAHTAGSGNVTYSNDQVRNIRLIDYGLAPFMAAIAARLGLDDMVPRGTAVTFDISDLTSDTLGEIDVPDDDKQGELEDEELGDRGTGRGNVAGKALHTGARREVD